MTTNDIDAIEARANAIANREQDDFPEIDVENSTLHISVQYRELLALCAEVRELRAALGRLQGEVETIINTEPHANNCRVVSRECNCWQARLQTALDGDK